MTTPAIELEAHAKINLFLEVGRKREDGYHEVQTVMQRISLSDSLHAQRRTDGIEVVTDDPSLPCHLDNLAGRGALAVLEALDNPGGVRIEIKKRVPAGAGLGGGSSDAASAMIAVNELYGGMLSRHQLSGLAADLGSDIAFFFDGGTALCTGRGERVARVVGGLPWDGVLLCPELHCETAAVYATFAEQEFAPRRSADAFWNAYRSGTSVDAFEALLFNRLEAAAFEQYPALKALHEQLAPRYPGLRLSGSGSAMYCIGHTGPEDDPDVLELGDGLPPVRRYRINSV